MVQPICFAFGTKALFGPYIGSAQEIQQPQLPHRSFLSAVAKGLSKDSFLYKITSIIYPDLLSPKYLKVLVPSECRQYFEKCSILKCRKFWSIWASKGREVRPSSVFCADRASSGSSKVVEDHSESTCQQIFDLTLRFQLLSSLIPPYFFYS
jgi:hypothetical protein